MRRILLLCLSLLLLFSFTDADADAPVHVDTPSPAEWAERTDILRLYVFKTYRSDAMLLTCGDVSMVVDAALAKHAEDILSAYEGLGLVRDGVPYVDYLLGTHPHNDHIEGIYTMVKNGLTAGEFLTSFRLNYRNEYQQKAIATMETYGIPVRKIEQGEIIQLGDAAVRLFWYEKGQNPNALSCLAHIEYGEATCLLTADCTGDAQKGVMAQVPAEWLKSDVMKAAHHGVTPGVTSFMDLVSPQFVFFTNSERNETKIKNAVYQLRNRKIPFMYNYNGRIVIETDGHEWFINQYPGEF